MPRLLLAAVLCLAVLPAAAGTKWHGPGWYVEVYHYVAVVLSGPYGTREACEAAVPAKITIGKYRCEYLGRAPG